MLKFLRLRLKKILNTGADVDSLLHEIISALDDEVTPADFPGGIELSDKNGPPIQINADPTDLEGETTVFNVTRGGFNFDLSLNSDGDVQQNQQPVAGVAPTEEKAFWGTVVSGTGSTYQVTLSNNQTVSVTQRQIDSGETIPAGTKAIVVKNGGVYSMQVPVWA